MSKKFTYAATGVNRELRARSKKTLRILKNTHGFSRHGRVLHLPYGNVFPAEQEHYLDLQIEGVGTKVLVAQLAEKYDTIGIDAVAMAVNDVIRSGAKPFALVDNIHTKSSDPGLLQGLLNGIVEGAKEAECIVPSGETGDVAEIIRGLTESEGFDIVVAALGEVEKNGIIHGTDIRPGDLIIGMQSSGLHSNGISLARRILFRQWGGKYEPDQTPEELNRKIVLEVLEPTKIYVKPFLKVAEQLHVKAAVHITGDAYMKFERLTKHPKGIGFEFNNFNPHPVFGLIQKTAHELGGMITDEEMFKTFNMGWGFAIIVSKTDVTKAVEILEKAGTHAERIGKITAEKGIRISYRKKRMRL